MHIAWLDRSAGVFDTLRPTPPLVVADLTDLAARLRNLVGPDA
jgi:hypothetical protein